MAKYKTEGDDYAEVVQKDGLRYQMLNVHVEPCSSWEEKTGWRSFRISKQAVQENQRVFSVVSLTLQ